jgi:hypothetical protein
MAQEDVGTHGPDDPLGPPQLAIYNTADRWLTLKNYDLLFYEHALLIALGLNAQPAPGDRHMVPMDLNPFGEDRAAQRRARTFTLKSRVRDLTARAKRSNNVRTIWLAILLTVFVAAIVYSLVTGEGSGPS